MEEGVVTLIVVEAEKNEFNIDIVELLSSGNFNLSETCVSLNSEKSSIILFFTLTL